MSKDSPTIVGLEKLREIRSAVDLPLVAIGGIDMNNVAEVKAAGADSVAVISAILSADDIEKATRQIVNEYERQQ
jgi:thiamine-phosphate diphosphorylase